MSEKYASGITRDVRTGIARVALTGVAANGFCFTWQNPHEKKIIVTDVIVNITTAGGTATAVMDVDVVASATDTGDDIIDGLDLNSTGTFDGRGATSGTNAEEKPQIVDEKGGTNDWITGKCLVEKCDDLAGYVYILYFLVED